MKFAVRIGFSVFVISLIGAPAALGQAVIPSDNPAVNQYTETFPTTGGDETTGPGGDPAKNGSGESSDPGLGRGAAKRLDGEGPAGEELTAVVEATMPRQAAGGETHNPDFADSEGRSGVPEALGQATGLSSSDGTGPLLPLAIITAVLGSLAFLWRRARGTADADG